MIPPPPAALQCLRWRLSLLMFLQYAPAGAVVPLFSLHLQDLGFSPLQIGWACATQSLGTLAAPLVAGQIADRWWPAERLLATCAVLAGALLWLLAALTNPVAVFVVSLAFWLLLAPALTLGTTLSFAHLADPARHFSGVRLWGTVGWVVVGWLVGYWMARPAWLMHGLHLEDRPSKLADAFRLGGLFAFALGLYALTLPHTPPQRTFSGQLAMLAAIKSLRSRALAVYWVCVGGVCITMPFTSQVTPLLLSDRGVSQTWIGPTLTLAQSTEVMALAFLPMLLTRLGVKGTLSLGLGAWVTALAILTVGAPTGLVVGSLPLNGLCICCFFVAGQVFVNGQARADVRASAQALIHFMIGFGMLAGNLLVGWVRQQVHEAFRPTFLVGAAIATLLGAVFLFGFPTDETRVAKVSIDGKP